jgi:hypothetical protein
LERQPERVSPPGRQSRIFIFGADGRIVGTRLSGSLITAIPGIDQQLPIVNLPGNQLSSSGTQFGSTALLGATVPLYDG